MLEFLRENYSLLTKSVEILAALTGILVYSKFRNSPVRYFIWILIGIAVIELIGGYTAYVDAFPSLQSLKEKLAGTWLRKNNWFYTIFWDLGATLALVYYFRNLLEGKIQRRVIKLAASAYVVASLVIIASRFDDFLVYSFPALSILGALLIILAVALYLAQILQSDKMLEFYKSPNFYFAAVLLLWMLITTPLVFYEEYYNRRDLPYVTLKRAIYLFSNYLMYLTFAAALLWCKPQKKF